MPLNNLETSLPPATSPTGTLTSGPSLMSEPTTLQASSSAISLPDLVDGPSPSVSLDGRTAALGDQEAAHVSQVALPGVKAASMTNATYGRPGENLSPSDALQQSLENRLRLGLRGSPLCAVIWKPWTTPWGRSLWKPRARVGINSEIAISLWPAATTPSGGQRNPPGTTMQGRRPDGSKATVTLQNVVLAVWSALRASDGEKGGPNMSFGAGGCPLPSQVSAIARSSNVPTENGGLSLHPEFAGWEMRYPPAWINCAPSETRSILMRRRNSSPQPPTHGDPSIFLTPQERRLSPSSPDASARAQRPPE